MRSQISNRNRSLLEIREFLEEVRPDAAEPVAEYVRELMLTAMRLLDDGSSVGDVKLLNASFRELRYALGVFREHSRRPKVTLFGSARTPPEDPAYIQAKEFARQISERGYDVVTGAGPGIMQAGNEGAGREHSFGLNIRLPFEQDANPAIRDDPKLVTFRYFFTRKLLFVKSAAAIVICPGGFGTYDEGFECLTLVQTGKSPIVPIVFLDQPGGKHWKVWRDHIVDELLGGGYISKADLALFRVTDSTDEALEEIDRFYRVYHSSRFVRDRLVIRLKTPISSALVERLDAEFSDLLVDGRFELRDRLDEEDLDDTATLPRLVFSFDRVSAGRLRQMIDVLNGAV